jgi:hypothetical protein
MSRKLWSATLCSSSPRYQDWKRILGSDEAPIINPKPFATNLGPEMLVEVYSLDVARLSFDQHARLVDFIVERFGVKGREVVRGLESDGFPIRAADVSVSYDLRAFL